MGGFRFFCDLFLVNFITVVLAQSSRNDKWHFDGRTRRLSTTVNKNTCTAKRLLQEYFSHAAAIQLKTADRSGNVTFHVGEMAEFFCKDGYRQIGELKSFICQDNGTWKPYSMDQTGVCVIKQCNSAKFSCKDGKTIIDACKQCDCIGHCPDLSDEASCAPIVIDVTGKATGILMSGTPHRRPNKSNRSCSSWKLQTNEQHFYIKLLFRSFSMSPNCPRNYVVLENVNFTDPTSTAQCCRESLEPRSEVCRFGGTTAPPLSRSITNQMTIIFFSDTGESYFTALWFNVNALYPNRAIPKQDATYADRIKLHTPREKEPQPHEDSFILALILFILLLFSLGIFLGFKFGKRHAGPACSFRYFLNCITRRPIPPYLSALSLSEDPEHRRLTEDVEMSFIGEEIARETPSI